jgi:hypothetical protein
MGNLIEVDFSRKVNEPDRYSGFPRLAEKDPLDCIDTRCLIGPIHRAYKFIYRQPVNVSYEYPPVIRNRVSSIKMCRQEESGTISLYAPTDWLKITHCDVIDASNRYLANIFLYHALTTVAAKGYISGYQRAQPAGLFISEEQERFIGQEVILDGESTRDLKLCRAASAVALRAQGLDIATDSLYRELIGGLAYDLTNYVDEYQKHFIYYDRPDHCHGLPKQLTYQLGCLSPMSDDELSRMLQR